MYAERASAPSARPDSQERVAQRARAAILRDARETLTAQANVIADLARRLDDSFANAVALMHGTRGHVVVAGVGKSGHIGRKIAATLSSTGTPSIFMHPTEAYHGDLGMITPQDSVLLISYSGETEEVVRLLPHIERLGNPVIALVGRADSTLGRAASVTLDASVEREACPNNLAPTHSTLAALAIGDALAVALMKARAFGAEDFARFHPGGALGRRLLGRVRDAMHGGELPIIAPDHTVRDSLFTITRGRLGLALVMEGPELIGIITDGDLRRAMQKHGEVLEVKARSIMSPRPVCISEDAPLSDAEELMTRRKIKALVVRDAKGRVSGVLEIFDR